MVPLNSEEIFEASPDKFTTSYKVGDIFIKVKTNSDFFFSGLDKLFDFPPASQIDSRAKKIVNLAFLVDYKNSFYPALRSHKNGTTGTRHGGICLRHDLTLVWKERARHYPGLVLLNKNKIFYIIPYLRFKVRDTIRLPVNLLIDACFWRMKRILLHASCVAKDSLGILIPGPARSGKTTFALYMILKKGFEFVSNDKVLLAQGSNGIEAIGIHEPMSIRKETLNLFPEISSYINIQPNGSGFIDPEVAFSDRLRKKAVITRIYLPMPSSQLKDVRSASSTEVLDALIPNAGIIPIKKVMDERLKLLARLVPSAKRYWIPWFRDSPHLF